VCMYLRARAGVCVCVECASVRTLRNGESEREIPLAVSPENNHVYSAAGIDVCEGGVGGLGVCAYSCA